MDGKRRGNAGVWGEGGGGTKSIDDRRKDSHERAGDRISSGAIHSRRWLWTLRGIPRAFAACFVWGGRMMPFDGIFDAESGFQGWSQGGFLM